MNTNKKTIVLTAGELDVVIRGLKIMSPATRNAVVRFPFGREEDIDKIIGKLEDILWEIEE